MICLPSRRRGEGKYESREDDQSYRGADNERGYPEERDPASG
jgi:hypothetical protein